MLFLSIRVINKHYLVLQSRSIDVAIWLFLGIKLLVSRYGSRLFDGHVVCVLVLRCVSGGHDISTFSFAVTGHEFLGSIRRYFIFPSYLCMLPICHRHVSLWTRQVLPLSSCSVISHSTTSHSQHLIVIFTHLKALEPSRDQFIIRFPRFVKVVQAQQGTRGSFFLASILSHGALSTTKYCFSCIRIKRFETDEAIQTILIFLLY